MLQSVIDRLDSHVIHRVWIISDLQQRIPENAELCVRIAVDDFMDLGMKVNEVFYLGDSVEGTDIDYINQMTEMQIEQLGKIKVPKYYVVGNHDYEYFRYHQKNSGMTGIVIPFCERVKALDDWRVQPSIETFCFTEDFGPFVAYFFPDHGDSQSGRWHTTNGEVWGDKSAYIYSQEDFDRVRESIAACGKPVFTFSHYSFMGGNRESPLLSRFLPLPDNVRMHFYGHAHIGDAKWAGKDCFRKIASVDNQPIVQINCASLENFRGSAIRSVFFEIYDNGDVGVLFRNHTKHQWDDIYLQHANSAR